MTHHRPSISQLHIAGAVPRMGASLMLLLLGLLAILTLARSIPEFIQRLDRDCTECGLVAFEPPLKPRGQTSAPAINPASANEGRLTLWFASETPSLMSPVSVPSEADSRDPVMIDPWLAATFLATDTIANTDTNAALPAWAASDAGLALAFARQIDPASAPVPAGAAAHMAWSWNDPRADRGLDSDGPVWTGLAPGGRVAVETQLQQHFAQIGFDAVPGGRRTASPPESFAGTEIALSGATFGGLSFSEGVPRTSAAGANPRPLSGMNGVLARDVFHAEASYGLTPAITPSIQYFRTADPIGSLRYAWPGSRGQTSAGVAAGVTFIPWNEPGSPLAFLNPRIAVRYVAYTEYAGVPRGAAPANALSLSLWGALRF